MIGPPGVPHRPLNVQQDGAAGQAVPAQCSMVFRVPASTSCSVAPLYIWSGA